MQQTVEQQSTTSNDPNCYITFDGQNVYVVQGPSGKVRIFTSPVPKGSTIASMYHLK